VLVREESLTLSSALANMMLLCRQQICTGRSPMYVCMYVCMYVFHIFLTVPCFYFAATYGSQHSMAGLFFLSLIQNCRYYRVARGPVVVKTG